MSSGLHQTQDAAVNLTGNATQPSREFDTESIARAEQAEAVVVNLFPAPHPHITPTAVPAARLDRHFQANLQVHGRSADQAQSTSMLASVREVSPAVLGGYHVDSVVRQGPGTHYLSSPPQSQATAQQVHASMAQPGANPWMQHNSNMSRTDAVADPVPDDPKLAGSISRVSTLENAPIAPDFAFLSGPSSAKLSDSFNIHETSQKRYNEKAPDNVFDRSSKREPIRQGFPHQSLASHASHQDGPTNIDNPRFQHHQPTSYANEWNSHGQRSASGEKPQPELQAPNHTLSAESPTNIGGPKFSANAARFGFNLPVAESTPGPLVAGSRIHRTEPTSQVPAQAVPNASNSASHSSAMYLEQLRNLTSHGARDDNSSFFAQQGSNSIGSFQPPQESQHTPSAAQRQHRADAAVQGQGMAHREAHETVTTKRLRNQFGGSTPTQTATSFDREGIFHSGACVDSQTDVQGLHHQARLGQSLKATSVIQDQGQLPTSATLSISPVSAPAPPAQDGSLPPLHSGNSVTASKQQPTSSQVANAVQASGQQQQTNFGSSLIDRLRNFDAPSNDIGSLSLPSSALQTPGHFGSLTSNVNVGDLAPTGQTAAVSGEWQTAANTTVSGHDKYRLAPGQQQISQQHHVAVAAAASANASVHHQQHVPHGGMSQVLHQQSQHHSEFPNRHIYRGPHGQSYRDEFGAARAQTSPVTAERSHPSLLPGSSSASAARPYTCKICNASFGRRDNMQKHMRSIHMGERPFECHLCGYAFQKKDHREKHIRTVHLKERPYECTQCSSRFGQKSDLSKHVRTVHDRIKPYQCEHCGLSFGHRGNKLRHVFVVHEKRKPFTCRVCNAGFGERSNLAKHITAVHKQAPDP